MQINTMDRHVEMGGVVSSNFNMKASAHAFDILSNRLYSDKVGAVIRELACNAWDSHVEAGKPDVPITIKLPNTLDPTFEVIDQGVGLSEVEVRTIFATYFESTKNDTNDQVGGLGLGCKSPFAYTEAFTITAIKNGKKCVFAATVGAKGIPNINLASTSDTDEPNGVKISLAVKQGDIAEFKEKAQEKLEYFKPYPKIVGVSDYKRQEPKEIFLIGEDWTIFKSSSYGNYYRERDKTNASILMGNVVYPVDKSQLDDKYNTFLTQQLLIACPIGDVSITPSREALAYDKHTIAYLEKKLDAIMVEVINDVANEIKSEPDYLSAWKKYTKYYSESTIYANVLKAKGLTHNGYSFPIPAIQSYCPSLEKLFNNEVSFGTYNLIRTETDLSRATKLSFRKHDPHFFIRNKESRIYWINTSLDKNVAACNVRIYTDMQANGITNTYDTQILKLTCSEETVAQFKKYFGDSFTVIDVSKLPKPTSNSNGSSKLRATLLFRLREDGNIVQYCYRGNGITEQPESYFVWLGATKTTIDHRDYALQNKLRPILAKHGYSKWLKRLYAVPKGSVKVIEKNKRAIHISVFAQMIANNLDKSIPIVSEKEYELSDRLIKAKNKIHEVTRNSIYIAYVEKTKDNSINELYYTISCIKLPDFHITEFYKYLKENGIPFKTTTANRDKEIATLKIATLKQLVTQAEKVVDKTQVFKYTDSYKIQKDGLVDKVLPIFAPCFKT